MSNIDLTGAHAHWLEILQCVVALIGVWWNVAGLRDAWCDWRWVEDRHINGSRHLVASDNLGDEVGLLAVQLLLINMGVAAVLLPPPPPELPLVSQVVSARVSMMFVTLVCSLLSYKKRRNRALLRRSLMLGRRRGDNVVPTPGSPS